MTYMNICIHMHITEYRQVHICIVRNERHQWLGMVAVPLSQDLGIRDRQISSEPEGVQGQPVLYSKNMFQKPKINL